MASKSLTVGEYSDTLLNKYLQHAFSDCDDDNLGAAAEEMYVLLRKLIDAAGNKSEDVKAPLKAIRNGIDHFAGAGGPSPDVDALFSLIDRLEALCEERIARRTDPAGAAQVQDVLRYRLTRLLVGDTWEGQPALKLRVLKVMFCFMVRENERLADEARDVPSLQLGRSRSIGRSRRDLGLRLHSKWQDAISEAGRMQGGKMLVLVKLLLLENMRLGVENAALQAAPAAASPATPDQLSPGHAKQPSPSSREAASPPPAAVTSGNLDDLLGLNDAPSEQGDDAPSRRSSSPSASTLGDDPFASLAGRRMQEAAGGYDPSQLRLGAMSIGPGSGGPRPGSPGMSSMQTGSAPPSGVQTPPNDYHQSPHCFGGPALPVAIPQPGGAHAPGPYPAYNSFPSYPAPAVYNPALQSYGSCNLESMPSGGQVQVYPIQPPAAGFYAQFDPASPYLGNPRPFEDTAFQDLSPVSAHRPPAAQPQAPPMRGDGK